MLETITTFLFAPGDRPDLIAKAAQSKAAAVIVDLEDAVAPSAKEAARSGLAEARTLCEAGGKLSVVRINGDRASCEGEVEVAVAVGFDAIMVPKVEAPGSLDQIINLLSLRKFQGGRKAPSLIALIESGKGVLSAADIASLSWVKGLALGTEDFALDIGGQPVPELLDLPVRQLVLAARAHGKAALAIPLSIAQFRDQDAVRKAAAVAASIGATGALCIHPRQVEAVAAGFAPEEDEICEAEAILQGWKQAQSEGRSVANVNGRMVDRPVVLRAQRILDRSQVTISSGEAA